MHKLKSEIHPTKVCEIINAHYSNLIPDILSMLEYAVYVNCDNTNVRFPEQPYYLFDYLRLLPERQYPLKTGFIKYKWCRIGLYYIHADDFKQIIDNMRAQQAIDDFLKE